jgi:ATP-dependent Clp protease, protease subunit
MHARASFGRRQAPIAVNPPEPPPLRSAKLAFLEKVTAESVARLALAIEAEMVKGADEIVLAVASPGGELLPMLEFYRTLLRLPVQLNTHAVGMVASAATILYLAGARRSAEPGAQFLFHQVSTMFEPPEGSFVSRSVERHRQLFEITALEIYRTRTRLPPEMIESFTRGEVILDAAQAVAHGVAQEIHELA